MLLSELCLLSEAVIAQTFGKKRGPLVDTGIEVPPGFDRFELDHKENDRSAAIIGIKGTKRTVISRAALPLAKELVKVYNQSGKSDSGIKTVSMMNTFGSKEMNALNDAGITLTEKPSYFEDFEKGGHAASKNIHQLKLKKVENLIGKLKEYSAESIFNTPNPETPQAKATLPRETMFIVKLGNGNRYLVDASQSRTYIRMWQKII